MFVLARHALLLFLQLGEELSPLGTTGVGGIGVDIGRRPIRLLWWSGREEGILRL